MSAVKCLAVIAGAVALTACVALKTGTAEHRVKISRVTQGLMEKDYDGQWHVYLPSDTVKYHVNGRCDVNGTEYACMWYGITFDFEATDSESILACTTRSTVPHEQADPTHIYGNNISVWHWELRLNGKKGTKRDPFYVVNTPPSVDISTTKCLYRGAPVLSFAFTMLPATK